jgi:2-polyprenyl-6-methoxyphenol hydroxylase-like FAD-dependent oxidoreductase/SAM-dependent methyltransferase
MVEIDAVVVGARCAGATLAMLLSEAGWRVLLVDRTTLGSELFPHGTVSTHALFPHTLHRLKTSGILDRLQSGHRIPELGFSWHVAGHRVTGTFTPVGGFDRATCIRRHMLDRALLDAAVDAGVEVRLDTRVVDLIGRDPVTGVVLDNGERIRARWTFGADGQYSIVARKLALPKTGERRGGHAYLFAYWYGLPLPDLIQFDAEPPLAVLTSPCEDDVQLLCVVGEPDLVRGPPAAREARYLNGLRRFPTSLDPTAPDRAERISPVVVAPETMMRGYYRQATGPGWALVGDAGHLTHPSNGQGIGDAIEQAYRLADLLTTGQDVTGFQRWRDDYFRDHDQWSFRMGSFGDPDNAPAMFAGLAADRVVAQQWRDLQTKRYRPSSVITPLRQARWRAAWAHEKSRRLLRTMLANGCDQKPTNRADGLMAVTVLHHMIAATAGVLGNGRPQASRTVAQLLDELDRYGTELELTLRRGTGWAHGLPDGELDTPAVHLAVHTAELNDAMGMPEQPGGSALRYALGVLRERLTAELTRAGLPAVALDEGSRTRLLGTGVPAVRLRASGHPLLFALSGRLDAEQLRGLDWSGDPEPYIAVLTAGGLLTCGRGVSYVETNRAHWDVLAGSYAVHARRLWAQTEPTWGNFGAPQSRVPMLPADVAGTDVLELGCGTGYVSAWAARAGARPVGLDISARQLATARQMQQEFGLFFPLVHADAERVPLPDASFGLVISEYGASIWCDPYRWIPESARLLRPGGRLIFLRNSTLLMLCEPEVGAATDRLLRPQAGLHRMSWESDPGVEFHLGHGDWIRLLRTSGFEIEDMIELFAPEDAQTDDDIETVQWARRWPVEEVWFARRRP